MSETSGFLKTQRLADMIVINGRILKDRSGLRIVTGHNALGGIIDPYYTGHEVPSLADRRSFLRERGWLGKGRVGWTHPAYDGIWTLAAAYRHVRGQEEAA